MKRRWSLTDYPVDFVDQGETASFPSKRFKYQRWRADALGAYPSGLGDTREEAFSDLEQKFADYVSNGGKLHRPGSKPKVTFAPAVEVSRFPELQAHFIEQVLQLPWAFLSDESSLWDFHGELDNDAFYQKIGEVYGVDVSEVAGANIAAILDEIMREIVEFPEDSIVRSIREGRDARMRHVAGLAEHPWNPYE